MIGTGASAVQFVPEIARVARSLTVFQRTGNWFLPRRNRPYPRAWRAAVAHVPGLQRWRRAFVTHYGEALTAMIRHPQDAGPDRRRAVGAVHARAAARPRAAAQGLARLRLRLQARAVQLGLPAGAGARQRGAGHRRDHEHRPRRPGDGERSHDRGRHHHLRDRLSHQRLRGADGGHRRRRAHAARGVERRRDRASRDHGSGLPVHVPHVRAQHQYLGRVDPRLPRGPGRLPRPGAGARALARRRGARRPARGRGTLRRRGAGALRGHRVDGV